MDEAVLLGAILVRGAFAEVAGYGVTADDFVDEYHAAIFSDISVAYRERPADSALRVAERVAERVRARSGSLMQVVRLIEAFEAAPNEWTIESVAKRVLGGRR